MRFDLSKHWLMLFVPLAVFYLSFLILSASRNGVTRKRIVPQPIRTQDDSTVSSNTTHPIEDSTGSGPTTSISTVSKENSTSKLATETAYPDLLTIRPNNGRLGNQMFVLAILVGLCDINKRKPELMPGTVDKLSSYFDLSQYPVVNASAFVERDPWSIGPFLKDQDHHIPSSSNIVKGYYYPVSFTFFQASRDHVTRLFSFRRHLVVHADGVLTTIAKGRTAFPVFVGVHVRRGDYLPSSNDDGHLQSYEARQVDMEYFDRAMEHYRSQFKNVVFVVVSDDRRWCRRHLAPLGMVVAPDSPTPGHDLALLSRCNHTLMTYGTFGFWGAYLAGGQAVYFSNFFPPYLEFTQKEFHEDKLYLPDWVAIDTTPPGYWNRTTTLETFTHVVTTT